VEPAVTVATVSLEAPPEGRLPEGTFSEPAAARERVKRVKLEEEVFNVQEPPAAMAWRRLRHFSRPRPISMAVEAVEAACVVWWAPQTREDSAVLVERGAASTGEAETEATLTLTLRQRRAAVVVVAAVVLSNPIKT
jgi:hypothetical protein